MLPAGITGDLLRWHFHYWKSREQFDWLSLQVPVVGPTSETKGYGRALTFTAWTTCSNRFWLLWFPAFLLYPFVFDLASPTKLYRCSFWMKHYKSKTPKRTRVWSPSWAVAVFGRHGKLRGRGKKSEVETTKVYFDKRGRRRYTASSHLKKTQILGLFIR